MNHVLVLSLSAVLLALFLIVVLWIKRGKVKRAVALLLLVISVMSAVAVYFQVIEPAQRRDARLRNAQQQLATTPVYRVIKQQQPALYKQLSEALNQAILQGMPATKAINQLRPMLSTLLNQHIGRASDETITRYMRLSVSQMQYLRTKDPQLCFKFLFPQVSGGVSIGDILPEKLIQDDLLRTEELLTSSMGANKTIDMPAARKSLQGIVGTLYGRWGNDLQQLNMPPNVRTDRPKICDMTIDLYRAVLELPTEQSANVLRMMLSADAR